MMSIGIVKSSMDLKKYFIDQDNYYLTDKSDIEKSAMWLGRGAEKLGIAGKTIEPHVFSQLVSGKLPDGQQIGLMRDGSIKHRPATDLTFSPPKSFSLMALVADDKRLIDVHNRAVEKVLEKVESLYAEARITKDGITEYEKTKNLVIAAFKHTSSREKDPALHTHAVILNMTERKDGKWRALSSRSKGDLENVDHGFREQIYANQHYLGAIYNSEIAKGATECNYDIRVVDKFGNFEIMGVPDSYIKSQSKRRTQILNEMEKRGVEGAQAAQKATLFTRERKGSVSPEELKAQWLEEAQEQNVNLKKIYQSSMTAQDKGAVETKLPVISQSAKQAVQDSIDHLSQYNIQIQHSDIVRQALAFGAGLVEHQALEQAIAEQLKSGTLVGKENQYYTTKALIDAETNLLSKAKRSIGSGFSIDVGHSGLAAQTLRHSDRLQVIDVKGLKNEANLINELVKTAESQDLNAYVLHPNRQRVDYLKESISRESNGLWQLLKNHFKHDLLQTVGKFQHDYNHRLKHSFFKKKQDYIIVTDAQKLSYQDLDKLSDLSEEGKSKVIFLNNTSSTEGFFPGNGIKILKESGVHALRSSSQSKSTIVELVEASKVNKTLANEAIKNSDAVVVALTNKAQQEVTNEIRAIKQDRGDISLQELNFSAISTKQLSNVEKTKLKSYSTGDLITVNPFTREQKTYFVNGINKEKGGLDLVDNIGIKTFFSLKDKQEFQVHKRQNLSISVGEQLKLTRDLYLNRQIKLDKGAVVSVKSITPNGMKIRLDKQTYWLSKDKLQQSFVDYGYVIKPHQLEKSQHAITALSGYQVNQNNIGEISEFADRVTLITDNPEKAKKALDEHKVSWLAKEVAEGLPNKNHSPIARTEASIRNDLEAVALALCGDDKDKAQTAVAYGIAKLGEREAGFKFKDLCTESVNYAIGKVTVDEVEQIISNKVQKGDLLVNDEFVTTPHALKLESKIIETNLKEQNKVEAVIEPGFNLDPKLTQGQKDAVSLALTTKDRFIGIQGIAGTGKTTMMKEFKQHAEAQGYSIVGIAPTHKAVKKLDESFNESIGEDLKKAGIPVMTAHSFLHEPLEQYNDKVIFVTDEVSMIGNRLYSDIQDKVIKLNSRNIFMGDIGQQGSIESGKPQELSMKNGLKYAVMDEILRQRESPDLLHSAKLAADQKPAESLKNLEKINPEKYIQRTENLLENTESFIEIGIDLDEEGKEIYTENGPSIKNLCRTIANDYLTRIPEQRDKTIVVASRHIHRQDIDDYIRNGLKSEGIITNEVETVRLRSLNLDQADVLHSKSYKDGMIVKFNRSFSIAKRDDHMTVTGVNHEDNTIQLQAQNGHQYTINPAKIALKSDMTVYESINSSLGRGDKIRLRTTNKAKGWLGGSEYTVKEVSDKEIVVLDDKGKELTIQHTDRKEQHWDYAYTNTTYSIQGDGERYVIGLETKDHYKAHYIQITRPYLHASIYTTDKADLIEYIESRESKEAANKVSAYEIMKEKPQQKDKIPKKEDDEKKTIYTEKPVLANDLKPLLEQRIEELSIALLGDPNKKMSSRNQLRFGSKGSLVVNLNTGKWYSHEEGIGGDSLNLIQREMGFINFKETLDYAKKFLNYSPESVSKSINKSQEISNDHSNNDSKKIQDYVKYLYNKSVPIRSTLAEKYLSKHRNIYETNQSSLRYLSSIFGYINDKKVYTPALLAYSKDSEGNVNHVQIVRLDHSGNKNKKVSISEQIYGKIKGMPIELNDHSDKSVSYLFKGVETALSILNVDKKAHVMSVLNKSNLANVDLNKLANKVVLGLDNDGIQTFTDKLIKQAINRLVFSGKDVSIIMPDKEKSNFNDVLNQQGYSELSKQINRTFTPKEFETLSKKILEKQSRNINKIDVYKEIKSIKKSDQLALNLANKSSDFSREIETNLSHLTSENLTYDISKTDKEHVIISKNLERKLEDNIDIYQRNNNLKNPDDLIKNSPDKEIER